MNERPARIALAGAHGFGAVHRRNLARLEALGAARLVAVADPQPPAVAELGTGVRTHRDLAALLEAEEGLDAVIVSTPLHTHFDLALRVLESGADLYLEKPPVTSLDQLARLQAAAARAGRLVQVGFQSLGSHAIPWLLSAIDGGDLGDVRAVTATGSWTRDRAYFSRSRWAGRRSLDGVDVVDGVATNALSHAVVTALRVAGARRLADVSAVDVDLHRANPTESDDTSVVRIRRDGRPSVTCALTLCGPEEAEPFVTVHGSEATATFFYVLDEVRVRGRDGDAAHRFGRTDLLENLLDARAGRAPLLSALDDTEAYMAVLEAVRTAPAPREIPSEWVDRVGEGDREHLVVRGVEQALARACAAEATFTELGLPWTAEPTAELRAGSRPVAVSCSGERLAPSLSPRPYLHPVRTPAGVTLTDHLPLDHPWHLGAGVAVPDVSRAGLPGANLWGGPDFVGPDEGYRWRATHGGIRIAHSELAADGLRQELTWHDRGGSELLRETREWRWEAVDERTWRLGLRSTLRASAGSVRLGSPGSKGRDGAGYGGFFWRFAPCGDIAVATADGLGEEAVNGSVAPWLLWSAGFAGRRASVLFVAPPESADPWFVRTSEYPGVGSALAWERPLVLDPGEDLTRTITVFARDGELARADVDALVEARSTGRS